MRVVSLVPSLTETLFELGLDESAVVGRTPWCIEPAGRVEAIRIVGGTKTPRVHKILALEPDLVVLDREENRRETWDELRAAGVNVWHSDVQRAADVPGMLRSLGTAVGRPREAADRAERVESALTTATPRSARPPVRAVPLI
jgi:ABC-type hemin transport system substrate-binding protein